MSFINSNTSQGKKELKMTAFKITIFSDAYLMAVVIFTSPCAIQAFTRMFGKLALVLTFCAEHNFGQGAHLLQPLDNFQIIYFLQNISCLIQ